MTGPERVPCEVCGRELRTKESRARGRGPVCDEKVSPQGRDHSPRRLRTGRGSAGAPAGVPGSGPPMADLLSVLDGAP